MATPAALIKKRFLALSLQSKIVCILLSGVLVLGATVKLLIYVIEYRHIVTRTEELLDARSQLERQSIELHLSSMIALAESIAGSPITANALADSRGREVYLEPLLRNQRLPISGATLNLTDYRGRVVAGGSDPSIALSHSKLIEKSVVTGTGIAEILNDRLLVALPVIYRLTGNPEGCVLLGIPLAELFGQANHTSSRSLTDSGGRIIHGDNIPEDAIVLTTYLDLPPPLNRLGLRLSLAERRSVAMASLNTMMLLLTGIGLLVIASMFAFARAGARFIAAPLGEIAAAAEQIATTGRPTTRLPIRRDDEFGRLSAAFNTMVDRLADSYADLEHRVVERTRELDESRREAEKAGSLLREAVASIAQGFTIYDENDRLVICNEAYRNFYAVSRDLIVPGRTFAEIIRYGVERGQYPEASNDIETWVAHRVAQHQSADGQTIEQRLEDGRWLLIVEHRTPSGYIVGNRIDITALKQTEAALRQREIYLRERTEQLNAIFDLSPDGFVSFDAKRRVRIANRAFLRMTTMSEAEVVGISEEDFFAKLASLCLAPERCPNPAGLAASVAAGDEGRDRRCLIELAGAGGRILELGLRRSQTDTVSQILYFRDVTHETEVDRMKSEFLSTAAHELRTPMASIYGFTELLLAKPFDDAQRADLLQTIYGQSELMIAIINELLDLARIEARRGKDFKIEMLDAARLIRQSAEGFKPPAGREHPVVTIATPSPKLQGDRTKLTQAIGNVLSNAYKYSPEGGEVSIALIEETTTASEAERVGIRITDNGIGMTPDQSGRVFERFYRADTSGKIPGTGLGMSIVKEIVELHGGAVELHSQRNIGTVVTLWLPKIQERESLKQHTTESP